MQECFGFGVSRTFRRRYGWRRWRGRRMGSEEPISVPTGANDDDNEHALTGRYLNYAPTRRFGPEVRARRKTGSMSRHDTNVDRNSDIDEPAVTGRYLNSAATRRFGPEVAVRRRTGSTQHDNDDNKVIERIVNSDGDEHALTGWY